MCFKSEKDGKWVQKSGATGCIVALMWWSQKEKENKNIVGESKIKIKSFSEKSESKSWCDEVQGRRSRRKNILLEKTKVGFPTHFSSDLFDSFSYLLAKPGGKYARKPTS